MKTRFILTALTIGLIPLVFHSSCSKINELATQEVVLKIPRTAFQYPLVTQKADEQVLYQGFVSVNVDSLLNAYGFSSANIKDPVVTKFSIGITSPSSATFSWLQSARAGASASSSFLPLTVVATATNAGATGKTVIMTVNYNVIPMNKGFYLAVYGTLTGPIPTEMMYMYLEGELKLTIEPL